MANTELILGVTGIVGTALAGIGSNYTTLAIERRRQHLADRNELRAVRRAIRLVRSDLASAAGRFESVVTRATLWPESESITDGHLDQYRELLAAELDDPAAWNAILLAEAAIDTIVMVLTEYALQHGGRRPPVDDQLMRLFAKSAHACEAADKALLPAEASLGHLRRRR